MFTGILYLKDDEFSLLIFCQDIHSVEFIILGRLIALTIQESVDLEFLIHIVYIISFAAIENFDGLIGACHLGGLLPLHRMQGVGEGLAAAVVGDGDGRGSPSR